MRPPGLGLPTSGFVRLLSSQTCTIVPGPVSNLPSNLPSNAGSPAAAARTANLLHAADELEDRRPSQRGAAAHVRMHSLRNAGEEEEEEGEISVGGVCAADQAAPSAGPRPLQGRSAAERSGCEARGAGLSPHHLIKSSTGASAQSAGGPAGIRCRLTTDGMLALQRCDDRLRLTAALRLGARESAGPFYVTKKPPPAGLATAYRCR